MSVPHAFDERAARSEANLIQAANRIDLYSVLSACYDAERLDRCAHSTMYKPGLVSFPFPVKRKRQGRTVVAEFSFKFFVSYFLSYDKRIVRHRSVITPSLQIQICLCPAFVVNVLTRSLSSLIEFYLGKRAEEPHMNTVISVPLGETSRQAGPYEQALHLVAQLVQHWTSKPTQSRVRRGGNWDIFSWAPGFGGGGGAKYYKRL